MNLSQEHHENHVRQNMHVIRSHSMTYGGKFPGFGGWSLPTQLAGHTGLVPEVSHETEGDLWRSQMGAIHSHS